MLQVASQVVGCARVHGGGDSLAIRKDGLLLALLHKSENVVRLYHSSDPKQLTACAELNRRQRRVHKAAIRLVRFSEDGRLACTAADDLKVVIWNVAAVHTGSAAVPVRTLRGHKDVVRDALFDEAGFLWTCGSDGRVCRWDVDKGELKETVVECGYGIKCLSLVQVFDRLCVASTDGNVTIYNTRGQNYKKLAVVQPDAAWLRSSRSTNHGGWMDPQRFHTGYVNRCAMSGNGAYLATCSDDSTCKIWNTLSLRNDMDSVLSFTRSEERRKPSHIISLQAQQEHRKDLNGEETPLSHGFHGTLTHTLRHDGPVIHVAFSADSEYVLTSSADCTVRLWRVYDAQQVYQINIPVPAKDMWFLPWAAIEDSVEDCKRLGRVFIATADRVVTIDLALREGMMRAAMVPVDSAKPAKRVNGSKRRSTRSQRITGRRRGGSGKASRKEEERKRGKSRVAMQQESFRKALAHATLAPQFLQELLANSSNGSWDNLQRNLSRYGLTEAMALRMVAQMKDFRPSDAALAFASTDPVVDKLFTALLSGSDYHDAMISFGFRTYTSGEMEIAATATQYDDVRRNEKSVVGRSRLFPAQQRNIMRLVMTGDHVARVHAHAPSDVAVSTVAAADMSALKHVHTIPLQQRTFPSVTQSARGPMAKRRQRDQTRRRAALTAKTVLRGLLETGDLNAASGAQKQTATASTKHGGKSSYSTASFVNMSSNLPTVTREFVRPIVASLESLPPATKSQTARARSFRAHKKLRNFEHPGRPVNLNQLLTSIHPEKPRLSHVGISSGRREKMMSKASDLWLRTNFDEKQYSDDDNEAAMSSEREASREHKKEQVVVPLHGSGSNKNLSTTVVASPEVMEKELARERKQQVDYSPANIIPGIDILFAVPETTWQGPSDKKFASVDQTKARPFVMLMQEDQNDGSEGNETLSLRTTRDKNLFATIKL